MGDRDTALGGLFESISAADAHRQAVERDLDIVWNLFCFMFIFLMQLGFAFLEAGSVRASSVVNVVIKNLADAAAGTFCWYAVGWAFRSGDSEPNHWSGFIGNKGFFDGDGSNWVLSYSFSVTAVTIVSGAVAERILPSAYLAQVVVLTGFVAPVVAYWLWSDKGWLSPANPDRFGTVGMLDFSGGTAVHVLGGLWGLLSAHVLGPRLLSGGRDPFVPSGRREVSGHDKFEMAAGTLMLFVSWLAFNGSGAGGITGDKNTVAAHAIAVTAVGGAVGTLGGMWISYEMRGFAHLVDICNSTLAALVAVTAGCAYVPVWAAVPIGVVAAGLMHVWECTLNWLEVDDVILASAVHLVPGCWGTLAVGLFADAALVRTATGISSAGADAAGLFFGGTGELLGVQLLGLCCVMGFAGGVCIPVCTLLRAAGRLRLPEEAEMQGIDWYLHRTATYDYIESIRRIGKQHRIWGAGSSVATSERENDAALGPAQSPTKKRSNRASTQPSSRRWQLSVTSDIVYVQPHGRERLQRRTWAVLGLVALVTAVGAADEGWVAREPLSLAVFGNVTLSDALARVTVVEELQHRLSADLDNVWTLACAVIVFTMQLGFCFLEAGGVRATSVQNIVFKNLADLSLGAVAWWAVGYAFAYGEGEPNSLHGFIGTGDFFQDFGVGASAKLPQWMISWVYMTTAVTIVSGAVAERISLVAYMTIAVAISAFAYPVLVHWYWSDDGWHSPRNSERVVGNGLLDFAGSCVVHFSGGLWAFVAAHLLGPRKLPGNLDVFSADGQELVSAHNKFQQAAGTLLLWFGWYAFNAGSVTSISGGGSSLAGHAMVVTTIGGASGVITAIIFCQLYQGYYNLGDICNAALAGLVSVTAGCGYIPVWAAVIVGVVGTLLYVAWLRVMRFLRIDDPIDACAVHLAGGLWGTVAVGLFASADLVQEALRVETVEHYGLFLGGGGEQLAAQLLGIAATGAWSVPLAAITCWTLRRMGVLRVNVQDELRGLDVALHHAVSYDYLTQIQRQKQEAVMGMDLAQAVADCLLAFDLDKAARIIDDHSVAGGSVQRLATVLDSLLGNLRLYQPFLPKGILEVSDTESSDDDLGDASPLTCPPAEHFPGQDSPVSELQRVHEADDSVEEIVMQDHGGSNPRPVPLPPAASAEDSVLQIRRSPSGLNPLGPRSRLGRSGDLRPSCIADSDGPHTVRSTGSKTGSDGSRGLSRHDSSEDRSRAARARQKLMARLREVNQLRLRTASLLRTELQWGDDAATLRSKSRSGTVSTRTCGTEGYQEVWSRTYAEICETTIEAVRACDGIALTLTSGSIVSAWNALSSVATHEKHACRSALSAAARAKRGDHHWVMAVTTGPVHVGILGGADYRVPCCVGEPLHVAGLAGDLSHRIRACTVTHARVYDKVRHAVVARPVDAIDLGLRRTEIIYELLGKPTEVPPPSEHYLDGFSSLRQKDFAAASTSFARHVGSCSADDIQGVRLLRISLMLSRRPELLADAGGAYARVHTGWDDIDLLAQDEVLPEHLAELESTQLSNTVSMLQRPGTAGSKGSKAAEEERLRRQINLFSTGAQYSAGSALPTEFTDTSGMQWHLSAKCLGKGSFGSVWMGMGDAGLMVAVKSIALMEKSVSAASSPPSQGGGAFFAPLSGFVAPVSQQVAAAASLDSGPPPASGIEITTPPSTGPALQVTASGNLDLPVLPDASPRSQASGLEMSGWGSPLAPDPQEKHWADRQATPLARTPAAAGPISEAAQKQVDELLREVAVMSRLRHDNIVSYLGSAVARGHVLIVMEYLSGGSLMSLLDQFRAIPVPSVRRYAGDILHGLVFLHERSIVHRDLKPHNVLCTIDGLCKLADFGTSQELSRLRGHGEDIAGTPHYMAPEACPGAGGAVPASDVWSFGIMLVQLLTGKLPWAEPMAVGLRFMAQLSLQPEMLPVIPESLPKDAAELASRALQRDPEKRPTAEMLLHLRFVIS